MTFLDAAKSNALANLRAPKRDLEERLFYRRHASPHFYTWGNSGLEPNLGSGNQLSSIDEAQRGLCNHGGTAMEHYVGLDVSLKLTAICIVDRTGKIVREGVVTSDPETIAAFVKSHAPHSEADCAKPRSPWLESLPSFCTGCGSRAPNSNGRQRRLPINLHSRTTDFPPTSAGTNVPAGTLALVRSLLVLRCSREQNALHTLIHQRHLTPSCGGHAPTAERTLDPARMFTESLTPRPELENGQDPDQTREFQLWLISAKSAERCPQAPVSVFR